MGDDGRDDGDGVTRDRRVLVVEDDRDVRESIRMVLEDAGYTVSEAENGRAALGALRDGAQRPVVILLDLMMPVMDGWEFRAAQLADAALADIPVVCVTAHPDARRTSPELRPSGWLEKPLDIEALVREVEALAAAR